MMVITESKCNDLCMMNRNFVYNDTSDFIDYDKLKLVRKAKEEYIWS